MSLGARQARVAITVLLLLLALPTVTRSPLAAAADASAEAQLVAWINSERADAGLHDLRVAADLTEVARRHSRRMAADGQLRHNSNRTSEVCCWQKLGENVAYGPDLRDIHRRLMASDGHRANIMSPDFTQIGIGVERRDGAYWVTEVFRLPQGTTAPRAQKRSEPVPEPAPEPSRPQVPAVPPPAPEPAPAPGPPPSATDRFVVMMGRLETLESDRPFSQVVAALEPDP